LGDEAMTRDNDAPPIPGTALLKLASFLFTEHFVSSVVQPTIADLQSEVAAAGPGRVQRLRAQWRGYGAFWTLVLVSPFASWEAPIPDVAGGLGRTGLGSIVIMLVAAPVLGAWVALVAGAGALVAILIHRWYQRHPSQIPSPSVSPWSSPQINFSSTHVGGNIGGLIFVVGSMLIVSLGLPSVFWFLLVGAVAACFVAWGLAAWHISHPKQGVPQNLIVWR
jgi:hypothetical protein